MLGMQLPESLDGIGPTALVALLASCAGGLLCCRLISRRRRGEGGRQRAARPRTAGRRSANSPMRKRTQSSVELMDGGCSSNVKGTPGSRFGSMRAANVFQELDEDAKDLNVLVE